MRLQAPQLMYSTLEPSHPAALCLPWVTAKHFINELKCRANRSTPLERLYNGRGHAQFRQLLERLLWGLRPKWRIMWRNYSALISDQPGAYAVRGKHVSRVKSTLLISCNNSLISLNRPDVHLSMYVSGWKGGDLVYIWRVSSSGPV